MKEIMERRSIRRFTDKKIGKEVLEKLLAAAMQAPSAGNAQAWEFVVIEDKKNMEAIMEFHPYAQCLKTAAAAVLICGAKKKELFHAVYLPQNCAAATQNLLLEAQHVGLGAVWLGVYPALDRMAAMRTLFSVPEDIEPFALVALGYPDEDKMPQERFDGKKVHWEQW